MPGGPAHPSVPTIDASAFRGTELARPGTWAVAFLADWCPFCRSFAPKFDALEGQGFDLAHGDVNSESSPLWHDFDIKVVPTVVVFRDGQPIFRANGRYLRGLSDRDLAAIVAAARPS